MSDPAVRANTAFVVPDGSRRRHSFATHVSAVSALMVRDLLVRFGRKDLGFIWSLLEPMILCTGVMTIWSFIHLPLIHGVPIIPFVVTGYMPLTLWRHLTGPMATLLRKNAGLLYHSPISHVDIALARVALEFLSTTAALLIIYSIIVSFDLADPPENPGLVLAGWLLAAWFYAGLGLLISALTELWDPAEKFIGPVNYLLLPLSGVFFMVDWMPAYAQKLLLLNPMINFIEMFRAGFFGEVVTTHYDAWYVAAWASALTVAGFSAVYHVRDRIQVS